jgi:hypothetical protein
MNARARGIEREDAKCRLVCLLTTLEDGRIKFTPMRKAEFAAYTISTTMDVLSAVFKAREHTAHIRVVGCSTLINRLYAVPSGSPLMSSQFKTSSIMLEKRPQAMAQKLAQSQRYTQHIPVTPRTTTVRVHLSHCRLPKIT